MEEQDDAELAEKQIRRAVDWRCTLCWMKCSHRILRHAHDGLRSDSLKGRLSGV
jgi:hypothetical protein